MKQLTMLLVMLAALGSPLAQGQTQTAETFVRQVSVMVSASFLLHLPGDYEATGSKRYPLLIFLHGAGERGDDLEKVKAHGPPKLVANGKDFPFIIVSPQAPESGWSLPTLDGLFEHVTNKYRVDIDRVYLTGLSMGGFATWRWAAESPGKFAAIAPIAGGGDPKRAHAYKDLPIWAFHGDNDDVVPVTRSQEMISAVTGIAAESKLTVYPDSGHDSWTETYDNPELYAWLLRHSRRRLPDAKP